MRDTLDHLPQAKQRELAHVVRVLFEDFEAATGSTTTKWKKQGRILKLVLYGSYARGDWVDDPIGGYTSDYTSSSSSTTSGWLTLNSGRPPTTG